MLGVPAGAGFGSAGVGGVKGGNGGVGLREARMRLGAKNRRWLVGVCVFRVVLGAVSPGGVHMSPPAAIKEPLLCSCSLGGFNFFIP